MVKIRGLKLSADQEKTALDRALFFSDGVFAIVITLLALDVHLPHLPVDISDSQLRNAMLDIFPKYLSFGITFAVVGGFWMEHQRRFLFVKKISAQALRLNMYLLLGVALVPYATSVLGEYGDLPSAVILYAGVMTVVSLLSTWLFVIVCRERDSISKDLTEHVRKGEIQHALIVPVVFALSIPLAYLRPYLAQYSWLLIPVISSALKGNKRVREKN